MLMSNQKESQSQYDNLWDWPQDESQDHNSIYNQTCQQLSRYYHQQLMRQLNKKIPESSKCQNNMKLLCKIILQLFKENFNQNQFSQNTKKYVEYAILSINESKNKKTLKKTLLDNGPQVFSSYSEYLKKCGISLSFEYSLIKIYQKQLRQFITKRKQKCLKMALEREIKNQQKHENFIQYFSAFVDDLQSNKISGKYRKQMKSKD